MAPKASSKENIGARRATRAFKQLHISTRSYMYACKKHIDILINYDAEGVILSKINTLRKWRPRRHPRRILVPEGHLTLSTVISTRSHRCCSIRCDISKKLQNRHFLLLTTKYKVLVVLLWNFSMVCRLIFFTASWNFFSFQCNITVKIKIFWLFVR